VGEAIVLDTSACFAFLENEPGADIVETHLLDARAERVAVHASFASLTEVEYITLQERDVLVFLRHKGFHPCAAPS
jgi:uncharacterized protein with PIN domain